MKKAIRIIVPLILVLAIIICSGWYLLVYDREFTRDVLLYTARYLDSTGNHNSATWFYNLAYKQAINKDVVAIAMADQYKALGNYTKAEYTLSQAIADGGGVDLYIALCKTYVEQDKLLDAVNMLKNVQNADIKAQLDALRPKTPVCSPDPSTTGSYFTQYITIQLTSDQGTLYASNRGEIPSVHSDRYHDGITLKAGKNVIYAVAVADNGLVSPTAIFGFTVGGVIEKVTFADPAVEAAVRQVLSVDSSKVLYTNDLWSIKNFTVPSGAKTLADLQHMAYLEQLTINQGISGQLSYISSLANLKELSISGTVVSAEELALISGLPSLQRLTLSNCGLSTINGLQNAKELVYLDLNSNSLRDITYLSQLQKLQELHLHHNALNDLQALASLTALSHLNVSNNNLTSIAPLARLSNLKHLEAANNSLTDISYVRQLGALEQLDLSYNSVADVAPLAACTNLRILNISNNALTNIIPLSALNKLAILNFSNNKVTALPQWNVSASELVSIDGSYNQLKTLEPLKELPRLNHVLMDYNKEIKSVNELASCPVLIKVSIYGTKVTDVTVLTDQSILVNYNPTQK